MKSPSLTYILLLAGVSFILCSCTTVTYPNGTTVTTPYVAPIYATSYPGYYVSPYGTGGVYGGGYYPLYAGYGAGLGWGGWGYGRCWNGVWNNQPCNNWNGGYRPVCNSWNGGYRPVCNTYASAGWNGYRGR